MIVLRKLYMPLTFTLLGLSLFFLFLPSDVQTAEGQTKTGINYNGIRIKVVSKFQCDLPLGTLKGQYNLKLNSALDTTINSYLSNKFDTIFSFEKRAPEKVIFLAGPYADGSTAFEAYPKVILFAKDSKMTESEFIDHYNNAAALIRITLVDFLKLQGCYDVTTYVQYSGAEVVIKELF